MSDEDDNLEFHGKQQYPVRGDDFDASGNDDDSPISGDDDNDDKKDDFDISHNNGNHFEFDDDDNDDNSRDKIINNETFSNIDVDVCGDKDNVDDGGDEAKNDNDDVDEDDDDDDDDDDLTETKTPAQSFIIFESTTITPIENIKNNLRSQTSCDVFTKEESNRDDYRNDDDDDDHVCGDDDVGGDDDDQKNDTLSSSHVLDSKVNQDETVAKESENLEFKLNEISVRNIMSPSWKQNEESSNQLDLRSTHGSNLWQFQVKDGKSFINNTEVQDGKAEIEIKQVPPPRMNRKKLADDWLAKIKSSSIVSEDAKIKVISSLAPNVRDVWKKREELSMEGSLKGCHFGGFEESMKECSIEEFDKQECTASKVMKRTPSYRSQGSSTVPNVVTYTNTGVKTRVNIAGNYLNYQPLKDPYRGVDRYGLIKMINDSKAKIIDLENENQNLKNVLEQQQTQSK